MQSHTQSLLLEVDKDTLHIINGYIIMIITLVEDVRWALQCISLLPLHPAYGHPSRTLALAYTQPQSLSPTILTPASRPYYAYFQFSGTECTNPTHLLPVELGELG